MLLGERFSQLPDVVQRLHRRGSGSHAGEVVVRRGSSWLSRLCAKAAQLPPAFVGPIRVDIDACDVDERWARNVDTHVMRSRLWAEGGLLCEQLGPVTFRFRLSVDEQRLMWTVASVRLLGLPLPASAFAAVTAIESSVEGRYAFDVSASLPLAGLLVHYRGWLHVD